MFRARTGWPGRPHPAAANLNPLCGKPIFPALGSALGNASEGWAYVIDDDRTGLRAGALRRVPDDARAQAPVAAGKAGLRRFASGGQMDEDAADRIDDPREL